MMPILARCVAIFSFRVTPVSSSRIVLRSLGRSLRRGLGSGLASFLLIMMDDSLAHAALLDARHHIPQPLVYLGIVDERSHGDLSPIDFAGDRLQALGSL